ncbi:uncharacterized protein MRET_1572 [Malassezia restricta]|jgi:hypothetical protein|uniref:uncharacterized protein n=1 Tax=Malassezia restricta TaxID=76775 RepID=UPI000DD1876E|nr:uncharacterized protein MRET_1572 [Malassezia restricta]AXA49389.1 uncharacterized protein MRET_1572 [Malassezia restricta]
MSSSEVALRRPKRKRSRKARTAVVSSDESSLEDSIPNTSKPQSPTSSPSSSDTEKDDDDDHLQGYIEKDESRFDEEESNENVLDIDDNDSDELQPPLISLPKQSKSSTEMPAKTWVDGPINSMRPEDLAPILDEKLKKQFHTLYMQCLTENFEDELDHIRQNDVRLAEDTSTSQATGRMSLLVDALSFGSEALMKSRASSHHVALALPKDTDI